MERKRKIEALGTLFILSMVNSGIYGVVYLRSGFYSVMQDATGLSHTQMGNIWTAYGVVAAVSYLFGGRLSDLVPGKKLVLVSVAGTAVCGCVLAAFPPYPVMLAIYTAMGIFAILTYYTVSVKIVNSVGEVIGRGKAFGLYWTLINLCNAAITAINIHNSARLEGQNARIFREALFIFIGVTLVSGVLFWMFYREENHGGNWKKKDDFKERGALLPVLNNRKVLAAGLIIFSNYLIISSFSYFVPYMRDVLNMTQTQVLIVNLIKGEVMGTVITLTAGVMTDQLGSALRLMMYASCLGAAALTVLTVFTAALPGPGAFIALMIIATACLNGAKSVAMVIPAEIGIPEKQLGTAVGVISFIGYLPDAFYYTAAGKAIDCFKNGGYIAIMALDVVMALACAALCRKLLKRGKGK